MVITLLETMSTTYGISLHEATTLPLQIMRDPYNYINAEGIKSFLGNAPHQVSTPTLNPIFTKSISSKVISDLAYLLLFVNCGEIRLH